MAKTKINAPESDNRYHDTLLLLKKYRDVVWSLELSVQQAKRLFQTEYGSSVEDFLESVYLAGADLSGSEVEHHAKSIARSDKMLKLVDSAVGLLRSKHKDGESLYWALYYSYLSPQRLRNVDEIVEALRTHICDVSARTYYRRRNEAVEALSSMLWGFSSKECYEILEQFFPETQSKKTT